MTCASNQLHMIHNVLQYKVSWKCYKFMNDLGQSGFFYLQ